MAELKVPEFDTYEEEATFWDSPDTGESMEDDGEWFTFETPSKRAVRVAILPEVAGELAQSHPGGAHRARARGVSLETLVNVFLVEHIHEEEPTSRP
jgi:hypothetical protein